MAGLSKIANKAEAAIEAAENSCGATITVPTRQEHREALHAGGKRGEDLHNHATDDIITRDLGNGTNDIVVIPAENQHTHLINLEPNDAIYIGIQNARELEILAEGDIATGLKALKARTGALIRQELTDKSVTPAGSLSGLKEKHTRGLSALSGAIENAHTKQIEGAREVARGLKALGVELIDGEGKEALLPTSASFTLNQNFCNKDGAHLVIR